MLEHILYSAGRSSLNPLLKNIFSTLEKHLLHSVRRTGNFGNQQCGLRSVTGYMKSNKNTRVLKMKTDTKVWGKETVSIIIEAVICVCWVGRLTPILAQDVQLQGEQIPVGCWDIGQAGVVFVRWYTRVCLKETPQAEIMIHLNLNIKDFLHKKCDLTQFWGVKNRWVMSGLTSPHCIWSSTGFSGSITTTSWRLLNQRCSSCLGISS